MVIIVMRNYLSVTQTTVSTVEHVQQMTPKNMAGVASVPQVCSNYSSPFKLNHIFII